MKRLLSLLMAIVMLFCLSACGVSNEDAATDSTTTTTTVPTDAGESTSTTTTIGEDTDASTTESATTTSTENSANKDGSTTTTQPPKTQPVVYDGSGDKVITNINLDSGRYKVHIVYTGNSVFSVFGYDADDDMVLMESSYGACDKEDVLRQVKFPLLLEITANGSWKIEFEKID